jgi:predicted HTH transcriptional regulator
MRPIEEWDSDYLLEVAPLLENEGYERKASALFMLDSRGKPTSATETEIAKQVCAFANAGDGFLVFGINNDGKLDDGIPAQIGRTPVKEWVEARIPKLTTPSIPDCKVAFIKRAGHHANDKGALVIFTALSDYRPHWIKEEGKEGPYLRTGSHSDYMTLQTFRDMISRTPSPRPPDIEILSVQFGPDWNRGALKVTTGLTM